MTTDRPWVRRTDHVLLPDASRVLSTLFLPGQEASIPGASRSSGVLDRVLALTDTEVERELDRLTTAFAHRHRDLDVRWDAHFAMLEHRLADVGPVPARRRRLIGAYFTQEVAVEAAGLLNPSMVAHPDQAGAPAGGVRFVMTVRAIGEGHVSSLELRTGSVAADGTVALDPSPAVCVPATPTPAEFSREAFAHRLRDDAAGARDAAADDDAELVLAALGPRFSGDDLAAALGRLHAQRLTHGSTGRTADRFAQIAASSYAVEFPVGSEPGERVLTPRSPAESHGIEDARMVRFVGPGGDAEHLGTYTAFDGRSISIQLLRTTDFRRFTTTPLSGPGARNKGLALFPRQVGGRYLAMSRADRENNAVTASADLLHWAHPVRVQAPRRPWEAVQLGNCGSPVETEEGWVVLTHGVGPMRTYSIGAILLDLHDPTVVLGSLDEPLLAPAEDERSGYVPNVVYSCGALRHDRTLVLPYGCSDSRTRIATVDLDGLLGALLRG